MALPDSITVITVSGTYVTPDGSAASGSVTFTPSVSAVTNGAVLPMAPYTVQLDSDGALSVDLAATDDADWAPSGFTYQVSERIDGARTRTYNIEVPAASPGGELDLGTIAPAVDVEAVTSYLLKINNLSDLNNAATARTNLGLGDSATKNVGTAAGTVAAGDHSHGGGGGGITSVNGDTGPAVTLDAADVGAAATSHSHAGADITSGTVATARLDTGTGGTQVALGNHNHSGTYANASHTHAQSDVTNLTTDLAGKANSSHSHAQSDITNLTSDLAGKASTSHNHDASYATTGHNHDAAYSATGHTHPVTNSGSVSIGTGKNQWPSGSTLTAYEFVPGFIMLIGGIESTSSISAGTTLVTIPSGFRPDRDCQFTMRHTVTTASTGTISVNSSTGAVTYNSAFNSGAIMDFTGVTYKKA